MDTCNNLDESLESYAEESQSWKFTYGIIPFIQYSWNDKIIEVDSWLLIPQSDGGGRV